MKEIKKSVCQIKVELKSCTTSWGTGFFVADNLIVTCYHVITDDFEQIELFKCYKQNGVKLTASLIDKCEQCDYALLRINEPFTNIHPLALCSEIIPGDHVTIFGYPDDEQGSIIGEKLSGTIEEILQENSKIVQDTILDIKGFAPGTSYNAFSGSPVLNEFSQVTSILKYKAERNLSSVSIKKAATFLENNDIEIKDLKSRTVFISAGDKSKFIGDFELCGNYLQRNFSIEVLSEDFLDNTAFMENLTLFQILKMEDKAFLLGNPGIGKSTELQKFAQQKWITGETSEFVPIFKSLRNFTGTESIENYLPPGWEELYKVVFIFDGIDEISDIEYFKSKLEIFIAQNEHKQKKYKYIISCRTNVYQSIVRRISNFKAYYLQDLDYDESVELLKKNCGEIVDEFIIPKELFSFLKTPFQISILSDYINKEKKFPTNITSLWAEYITGRLSHDKKEKLEKIQINVPMLKKWSKKVAMINELMKSNIISEDQLYSALNEDTPEFEAFKKNPLLNQKANEDNYFFEHRNLQEYFAALSLSNIQTHQIIDFISIEKNTNKTHPSLFNTITFLLNILQGKKYDQLVKWLSDHEPELLFKADSSRIHAFREPVFQKYFKSQVRKKTYWINNNKTFTIKEIAAFADCKENFEHLMVFVNKRNSHYRISISALELLNHFTIPDGKSEILKEDFIKLLKEPKVSETVKSYILECIYNHQITVKDTTYLSEIFEFFKEETNKEINHSLLSLLQLHEEIDDYFWFINDEFLREIGVLDRVVKDKKSGSASWTIELIIIRLKNPDNFISVAKYYFDDTKNINSTNRFSEELLTRCLYFHDLDEHFLVKLLSSFKTDEKAYYREDLVVQLLLKSNLKSQFNAFQYIIGQPKFRSIERILAMASDSNNIGFVMDQYRSGSLDRTRIDIYRNAIEIYGDRELAGYFYHTMTAEQFLFVEPFLDEQAYEELKAAPLKKAQENFDLLFDQKKLTAGIKSIFKEFGNPLDSHTLSDAEEKWYNTNGHHKKIDIAYSVLRNIVNKADKEISSADIDWIFQYNPIIIEEIKSHVESLEKSAHKFQINSKQKQYIENWCVKAASEIRFDKILKYQDSTTYTVYSDYFKLEIVLYFAGAFDIELSQDFLLNSIEFFEIDNFRELDTNLKSLIIKIKDEEFLDAQITKNLQKEELIYPVLDRHIQYALDRKLSDTYHVIKNYFSAGKTSYNIDKKLAQYIAITDDRDLLRQLCIDVKSSSCWSSVKLMMDLKIEKTFCKEKAVEYLEMEIIDDRNYLYTDALSVLFELNSSRALKYVCSFLKINKIPSLNQTYYTHYDAVEDYGILEDLFHQIYMREGDEIGFSGLGNFLPIYVSNLSKEKSQYEKTKEALNGIKEKFEKKDVKNGLYHINQLLDSSLQSFLNSQSRAMSFAEALEKVEEIL